MLLVWYIVNLIRNINIIDVIRITNIFITNFKLKHLTSQFRISLCFIRALKFRVICSSESGLNLAISFTDFNFTFVNNLNNNNLDLKEVNIFISDGL